MMSSSTHFGSNVYTADSSNSGQPRSKETALSNPSGRNVKPFIGSFNFEGARDFYVAIGWQLNWEQEDIAELELGGSCFYLQRYYQEDWCNNTMLHITVDDATAWYEHVSDVIANQAFASASSGEPRVSAPKEDGYGSLVTHVWDPSGNLLHFAQPLDRDD